MHFDLDRISGLVTLASDWTFFQLEERLQAKRLTTGFFSSPGNNVTVQKALEEDLPNERSGFGPLKTLCTAVKAVTRDGIVYETKRTPSSAAGPDFKKLFIGSKGEWGRIVEATLKVFPL